MDEDRKELYLEPAQQCYSEMGRLHNKMEEVMVVYEEQDLTHLESYKQLEQTQAKTRSIRGFLAGQFGDEVRRG